ncbi:MAG TPA: hypothetical protein DHV36_06175 [Desulfobacteraceae bacterium]|nr:hypothetical protein [Desulfobacteraceae bacterium]|tara:strand:+ start:285 stop:593 length:309 start_codon:yes stop_codon:yes gene_type:complete
MSEDLAFRIQLGIVLPKMKEMIASDLNKIVGELVDTLQMGTREGEELTAGPIKEIIMKDFEIFIDETIMPEVEKKIAPPAEAAPEEEAADGDGGEEEAPADE